MFRRLKIKIALIISSVCLLVLLTTTIFVYYNSVTFQNRMIERNLKSILAIDINTYATSISQSNNATVFLYSEQLNKPYTEQNKYSTEDFQVIFDAILEQNSTAGEIEVLGKKIAYTSKKVLYWENYSVGLFKEYALYDYTEIYSFTNSLIQYIWFAGLLGGFIFLMLGSFFAIIFSAPIEKAYNKEKKLIADVSHELKTPLAIILTDVDILKNNKEESVKSQEKWIKSIESQSTRMNLLIKDMLKLSMMDNARNMDIEEINLSSLLEESILLYEAYAYEKGITFKYDIKPNIMYKGPKTDLSKLFTVLIDNAVKYNKEKGKVIMQLKEHHKKVVFTIRNDGEGIKEEQLPYVFERFYKIEESRNQNSENSFGLGLSIAKSIVDFCKGTITVESVVNEYTEFKVVL